MARPIRPVFSHDVFVFQRVGGVSRYVVKLHAALRRLGVPSTVVAPVHINEALGESDHVLGALLPESFRGAQAPRLGRAAGRFVEPAALALLSLGKRAVVHHRTYYTPRPPNPRQATVITVYDMIHEHYPGLFEPDDPTSVHKRIWVEHAHALLAISHYTKQEIVRYLDVAPDRVTVAHLGVEPVEPDPSTLELLARARPFLLHVGRRAGYKNFDRLLRAFARSAAARAGVGLVSLSDREQSQQERALIEASGLDGIVSFVGGDDAVMAAYYARAIAFVYPSLDEGFGLSPLEAMLQGCPVVAADAGAIPEVVGEAALLFDPTSIDAIGTALDRIVEDASLRAELAARGRARAATFTWEQTARRTLEAYQGALEALAERS